jgi:hypothetical protein
MKRLTTFLLFTLLAGCGSGGDGESGGSATGPLRPPPAEGELSDLNGLPLEEFVRAIVPRLAEEPGSQDPAELAAALDQKWKIHCENICRIERK